MKHLSESWRIVFDATRPEVERQDALLVCIQWPLTQDALKQLQHLVMDSHECLSFRASVVLSLGRFTQNFPWMFPLIADLLTDVFQPTVDNTLRRCVVQALAASRHVDALPLLLHALKDPDNHVFADAAEALGRFGLSAVPALSRLLQDVSVSDDAKCVAAWQLGEIGHRSGLPALLTVLNAPTSSQDVRALCIWAIGQVGVYTIEVMDTLKSCRQESEPEIRLRAETALTKVVRNMN